MIVYPDIDKVIVAGFRKIDPDQWEFGNDEFIRGQRHLLKNIHRRKPIHSHSTPPQGTSSTALSPSERQEYEDEIKKLKNETGSLRLQLQNHKRENQENETKLTSLNERLRSIKLKQRKMISFLAQSLEKPKISLETNSKKRRLMISTYLQDEANADENENLDIHELITKLDSKLKFWAEFVEDVKTSGQEKYDLADSPTVSLIYTNQDSRVKTKSSGIDVNAEPVPAADVKPVKSGANDVFWEQFLTETPGGGDTQEVQSERRDVIKSLWSMNNLDKITEKMGNLSPSGRQIYDENDDENVPLYYHINKDFSIPFGREEFCLVTGLRFGVQNWAEYDTKQRIPFRRRVFPSYLDGQPITGIDIANMILDQSFAQLYDDDVVGLCCLGILQLVILGVESKRVVPDWMLRLANDRVAWDKYPWGSYVWPTLYSQLRNANVKRWSPLYVDEPTR
ncbi:phospholipase-like protein [Tanacetum coccineum]